MTEQEMDQLITRTVNDIGDWLRKAGSTSTAKQAHEAMVHYVRKAVLSASESPLGHTKEEEQSITYQFLRLIGIPDPTESDYQNLCYANRALVIAHERNIRYKDSWKQAGWRGAVFDIRKKAERLFRQFFSADTLDHLQGMEGEDDAYDLINFAIFFLRARAEKNEWGKWL